MAALSPEQRDLLIILVEADRSIPRSERNPVMAIAVGTSMNLMLVHKGLQERAEAYPEDLSTLGRMGFLNVASDGRGYHSIDITNTGYDEYSRLINAGRQPVVAVDETIRRFVASDGFRTRHSMAFAKWEEAAELLWRKDSREHLTKIGHLCREASQAFGQSVSKMSTPTPPALDPTRTKDAIRVVLEPIPGDAIRGFLSALHAYWCSTIDLVQRQEHGATREGMPLEIEDGRLVVFATLVAMTEIDRALLRYGAA